jgi:outer membrane protein TolC
MSLLSRILIPNLILLLILTVSVIAQNSSISLLECYRQAQLQSSLGKNPDLMAQISQLQQQNIDASRMPMVKWNAKATWQNEVFGLPFSPPGGIDLSVPHYNLQTSLETSYLLYDGGLTNAQKAIESAKLATEQQTVAVELNKLKDQVNQYFFGAILLQQQANHLQVTVRDLEARISQMEAGLRHGVVLDSDLKKLQVELLKLRSVFTGIISDRKAMLSVLSSLTGTEIMEEWELKAPDFDILKFETNVQRPELVLFDLQKKQLLLKNTILHASDKPKVGAFVQAGVGYPDPLNFFDEKISPFAIFGVQFSWKIWDWKNSAREHQQLEMQSMILENQKKAFEQNLSHQEQRFLENIRKIQEQLRQDDNIVTLQGDILKLLASQLDNGVITTTDYLLQSNAELQARLNQESHKIQLLQVQALYWTWKGWF